MPYRDLEKKRRVNRNWYRRNRHKQCEYRQRIVASVHAALGGKCARCGFADSRALQVDHVRGGGAEELARITRHAYYMKVLASVARGESTYQLLCANCNWIKRVEHGETGVHKEIEDARVSE